MVWGRGRREIREAASQVIHREHFLNRNIFSLRPAGICKTVVCLCVCFVCVCVTRVCVCVCQGLESMLMLQEKQKDQ